MYRGKSLYRGKRLGIRTHRFEVSMVYNYSRPNTLMSVHMSMPRSHASSMFGIAFQLSMWKYYFNLRLVP